MHRLAQLHAREICDDDSFIEGYGPAQSMGIKFRIDVEVALLDCHADLR